MSAVRSGKGRAGTLTGWWPLVLLVVRRDRVRLAVWVLGLAGLTVASAASLPAAYPDQAAIDQYAELFGRNLALVAFAGPGYGFDDPNLGVILVNETQVFAFIGVALMSIFLVNRSTRAEEDSERADLVRSNVVGRHAPTAAAVAVVALLDVIVGALCAIGFVALDYPAVGSLALAASFVAVGWVFTGVAVVAAQVLSTGRGALGAAGVALGVAFVVRAVGDIGDNGVSWASPLGWAQAVRAFADERWWTLGLCVIAAVGLVVAGFWLSTRRDLGAGLIPPRLGPATSAAWATTPLGLAVRLQRGPLIGWTVGMLVAGAVFGSLTADIEQMVADNPTFADMFALDGATVVDSFLATVALMLALVAAGFSVAAALRPRSEETSGHAEQILATATSRRSWLVSHLTVAVAGTAVVILAGGLGAGVAAAVVTDDAGQVASLLGAAVVTVPAVLVLVGLAAALYGTVPRAALVAWAALGFMAVVGYLGRLLRFPDWTLRLSPMEHVPAIPADDLRIAPLAVLCGIAAVLIAVGIAGFDRRDVNAA